MGIWQPYKNKSVTCVCVNGLQCDLVHYKVTWDLHIFKVAYSLKICDLAS